jgi:2-polyprenyl-6-methoxyphenol hydroxylase-like FAD-dependent oxidoreductase
MTSIGIVGAGVGGLHLALYLAEKGVSVTLYSDATAQQIRDGRLMNAAAHWENTRARERALGVNFFDDPEFGIRKIYFNIGLKIPKHFEGTVEKPGSTVDHRLYTGRLLEEFERRKGNVLYNRVATVADIESLTEEHDLVVIAAGKFAFTSLFPRDPELSLSRPQRKLTAAIWEGYAHRDPTGLTFNIIPNVGELFENPMTTFDGNKISLFFEMVPGQLLDRTISAADPRDVSSYENAIKKALKEHMPWTYERLDAKNMRVRNPKDIVSGSITPTARIPYTRLRNGKYIAGLGDIAAVNDPLMGQGSNSAVNMSWTLGQMICEEFEPGEAFLARYHARVADYNRAVAGINNVLVQIPVPDHGLQLMMSMRLDPTLCDWFASRFGSPEELWGILKSADAMHEFLRNWNPKVFAVSSEVLLHEKFGGLPILPDSALAAMMAEMAAGAQAKNMVAAE